MAECRVLCFPISEKKDEYFLLEWSPINDTPLDIKLVGTEGTESFTTKIRHRKIQDLKASSGHCSDDEWKQILTATFVNQDVPDDINITAEVDARGATLNFRKNIQGITQRLGSIKLSKASEDEEISLFDWCTSVIGSRTKVVHDLAAAKAKADSLEQSVKELEAQLEELIKAKDDDETQLLEKFTQLLNEKKLKIKQQQRLLATAEVNPQKLANVGASQKTVRKAQASRRTKRKATNELSSDSDDGFEKMDVDQGEDLKEESDTDDDGGQEQQRDRDETTDDDRTRSEASDSDDEPPPPKPAPKTRGRKAMPAKGKKTKTTKTVFAKGKETKTSKTSASASTSAPTAINEDDLPPRRTLPFATRKKAAAVAPKPAEDDETASDDDDEEM